MIRIMTDLRKLKFVWTTKPSRPMRRRKQLPEGLFSFSTSSNGSTKENTAIQDFNQVSNLQNGSKGKENKSMDVVSEFRLPVSHEKSAREESFNIVTKKRKKGPSSNNIVKHTNSLLVNSFKSKKSLEDNNTFKKAKNTSQSIDRENAIPDKSTPVSTGRINMIPVRRLEDNFLKFSITSINDDAELDKKISENNASTNDISSDLSKRKRPTIAAVSPVKKLTKERYPKNSKQANISSANTVLGKKNEEKLEFLKGITSNGKEPELIKPKTSKYKITFPRKKKPPLSVQLVSTPCVDDKKWYINKVNKPKPKGTKEKPKLIPKGVLSEVLLWSGKSSDRRITDLTDLEVAYTVIKSFFNEYSPENEKMSKWVKKYEKYFEIKVAEKLLLVESYQTISKKIRKLCFK